MFKLGNEIISKLKERIFGKELVSTVVGFTPSSCSACDGGCESSCYGGCYGGCTGCGGTCEGSCSAYASPY